VRFFTDYFLHKLTPTIKGALASDGGSYRLCQVTGLGSGQNSEVLEQCAGSRGPEIAAGSERGQPSLLRAETSK